MPQAIGKAEWAQWINGKGIVRAENSHSTAQGEQPRHETGSEYWGLASELTQTRELNAALLAAFDTLEDGLLLLDPTATVVASNQALARLLGSTPAALHGANWQALCHQHGLALLGERVGQVVQQQHPYAGREHLTDANGINHILDVSVVPLWLERPPIGRMLVHITDVTQRLHLEALLIESQRRATSARLSATIAHEVNTPLQSIQSALYLARRTSQQRCAHYMEQAIGQVERIGHILQRLLELHDTRDQPPGTVHINKLLEHLLNLLQVTLHEERVVVWTDLAPDIPWFWGQPDSLNQALLNLISNAIEAMPGGGTLSICTRQAHIYEPGLPTLLVEIADTGSGMTPDVLAHSFDPFFTTRPGGAGVGLTVSQSIIAQHGGQIRAHSKPGVGSTFTLTLPLTPPPPHASELAAS